MAKAITIHPIAQQILNVLGTPPNLVLVAAKNIFDNRWRINIWCSRPQEGQLTGDHTIAHSYFVHVDKDERITFVSPAIVPTCKTPPSPQPGPEAASTPVEEATAR